MLSQVKFAAASPAARASSKPRQKRTGNWLRRSERDPELRAAPARSQSEVRSREGASEAEQLQTPQGNPNRVDPDYVSQVKALLEFYEFGRPSAAGIMKPETARAVVEFIEGRHVARKSCQAT